MGVRPGEGPNIGKSETPFTLSQANFAVWPNIAVKPRRAGGSVPAEGNRALRRIGDTPDRRVTSTRRTARCGQACRVVWHGVWRQVHTPMLFLKFSNQPAQTLPSPGSVRYHPSM
jgi:hypothetical protein